MQIFIARQPIFDVQLKVVGYELLSRAGEENVFQHMDGDHASDQLVSKVMNVWGLDSLSQGKQAFVNLTRKALLNQHYRVLPPEQTILEILETVHLDDEVLTACDAAREMGYTLALDDYVLEEERIPSLSHFNIVKMDFVDTHP